MDQPTSGQGQLLLGVAAVLWVIWGLVHMFAGIVIMAEDATGAVQAVADAVPAADLAIDYPAAAGALINQHGFNLLWIGCVTTLCAYFIWRRSVAGIFLAALVGGLADVGYFIFLDLGGFVRFTPGTVMTIFSGSAIALTFFAYIKYLRMPASAR
ncbi:MAG: hypothetical protein AAGH76_11055 [Pseudomonadota bacterium]